MTNKELRRKFEALRREAKELETKKLLVLLEAEKLREELEEKGVKL